MYSPNELNTEYGRECRARKEFWDALGIARGKGRSNCAKRFGFDNAVAFANAYSGADLRRLRLEHEQMKAEKEEEMKAAVNNVPAGTPFTSDLWISFDEFDTLEAKCINYPNKEEETMNTTETRDQRYHLETRLGRVNRNHDDNLRKQFHMDGTHPTTSKEAIELLKAGKFSIDEDFFKDFDDNYPEDYSFDTYTVASAIDWGMPKADKAGYKAAKELLGKAYTEANDAIKILDPEKGLEALRAFESATFH